MASVCRLEVRLLVAAARQDRRHPVIVGRDAPVRADTPAVEHRHAEVASGMLDEALQIERPEAVVAVRRELRAQLGGRLQTSHPAAFRGEERLQHRGAEARDRGDGLVDVLGDTLSAAPAGRPRTSSHVIR